jgi:catechol 2,3-dioxygenase-like lactoylglutathione lyase family enzyme
MRGAAAPRLQPAAHQAILGHEETGQESNMANGFHHIHLKSRDPEKSADWFVRAFGFKIETSVVRPTGDRFIVCTTADGKAQVVISGERTGETLPSGSALPKLGLEHFAMQTDDLDADLQRLGGLGAKLLDGPTAMPNGIRVAFVQGPDDVRIELLYFPKT